MANPSDYVAAVGDTLTAVAGICGDIDDLEWERPTGCPGWSVKDNVSHICDVERLLLGDPPAGIAMTMGGHVVNLVGERMEPGVELRRAWSPSEVLADLETTTARRLEQLAHVNEQALEEIAHGHPLGPMPLRTFLTLRVFDLFTHEQDIRRAVNRRGDVAGPAAQMTLRYSTKSLARFLYEKAPETRGSVFGINVHEFAVTVDLTGERSAVRYEPGGDVQLSLDIGNYMAWIGGRSDRAEFVASGDNAAVISDAFCAHAGMTP